MTDELAEQTTALAAQGILAADRLRRNGLRRKADPAVACPTKA